MLRDPGRQAKPRESLAHPFERFDLFTRRWRLAGQEETHHVIVYQADEALLRQDRIHSYEATQRHYWPPSLNNYVRSDQRVRRGYEIACSAGVRHQVVNQFSMRCIDVTREKITVSGNIAS